ncbi:hypothetical protein [Photobacterium indicum]|uniref:Uncharacterized protein n=1 Tax=Photobacterium indicum TaxID=81447 RepID=A0A2T3L9Z0_9GAMM|nr:hypothetical protein [Photobacterium indicum]PSV48121.1 hypothetical protein C9J47_06120 [Photobacterium indicum]
MEIYPTCNKCGQSDEYLVSHENKYICICGHEIKITESTLESNDVHQGLMSYPKEDSYQMH